jgi:LacI family transcriptional regulator
MNRPTLKDVCREALVSEATVSRVINNSPLVNEKTRQRVLDVIRRLGYTPNAAARNLSRSKTDAIGVIFHEMSSGFFADVMDGIDRAAAERGYRVFCSFTRDYKQPAKTAFSLLDEMRVDGLILLDLNMTADLIEQFKAYRKPVVLLQQQITDPRIHSVSVANEMGGYLAMKHLLSLRYDPIVVIRGPANVQDSQLREKGCLRALQEAGRRADSCVWLAADYQPGRAREVFRQYLQQHGAPRAVFAFNDSMALAVLGELREKNISVPGQTALIGFDGIECGLFNGLSTVETPLIQLGAEAVRVVVDNLEKPDAPAEHVELPVKLVLRQTCPAP